MACQAPVEDAFVVLLLAVVEWVGDASHIAISGVVEVH
jgi:hypothetical protein